MNKKFQLFVAALVAAVVTVSAAAYHGAYTGRWQDKVATSALADRVADLPLELGEWEFVDDNPPLGEFVSQELGLYGHENRIYRHRTTGSHAALLLMVGSPGPLVRHPPSVCYANRANRQIGDAKQIVDDVSSTRFELLEYEAPDSSGGGRFFVAYGHTVDGNWDVPALPRVTYGGAPVLYKVQLLMQHDPDRDIAETRRELENFVEAFTESFRESVLKP